MSRSSTVAPPRLSITIAALGIVFGDIGTSPLYAFRESFLGLAHLSVTAGHIFGVLSMIFWSMIIVISIKYLLVVMRADNNGEGGIIALVSLLYPNGGKPKGIRALLILLGIFGAALLYGDGTITPAISVLSAVEGLEFVTPAFKPFIIPITIVILIGLFSVQRYGTAKIGKIFGPVMLLWFFVLGLTGLVNIVAAPQILQALSPVWAFYFVIVEPFTSFLVMGTVFLVVTGGEALYADMGHFGLAPIRMAWFFIAFPCLLLNYFGQGALVLSDSREILHPFFHLAPEWAMLPMVILATCATIIASQAVISGVFSLTRQAIQLGSLPRMRVVQTHGEEFGQIYIPSVNRALMVATIALVIGFGSSGNLASAYGLAIAMDMVITTILVLFVLAHWRWSKWLLAAMTVLFLPLDLAFLIANALKFLEGGWYPMVVGLVLFTMMTTWSKGRAELRRRTAQGDMPVAQFLDWLSNRQNRIVRTPGTAVFLTSLSSGTPVILRHHVERNLSLHDKVILLHIETHPVAHVEPENRVHYERLSEGFHRITLHYGFNEEIDVPGELNDYLAPATGLAIDDGTTYYLGRETLLARADVGLPLWRAVIFARMSRNAGRATAHFHIPPEQVIELGLQVEI